MLVATWGHSSPKLPSQRARACRPPKPPLPVLVQLYIESSQTKEKQMVVLLYMLISGTPLTDSSTLAVVGELLLIDNLIVCLFLFGKRKVKG